MKAFEFIKEELAGWHLWEVIGLLSDCAIITVLSIYWHDYVMGFFPQLSG